MVPEKTSSLIYSRTDEIVICVECWISDYNIISDDPDTGQGAYSPGIIISAGTAQQQLFMVDSLITIPLLYY